MRYSSSNSILLMSATPRR